MLTIIPHPEAVRGRPAVKAVQSSLLAAGFDPLGIDGITGDNTLEIRQVHIVARTDDPVFVGSGLENGERVITSGLAAPVAGSPLKLISDSKDQPDIARTVQDESPAKNGAVAQ